MEDTDRDTITNLLVTGRYFRNGAASHHGRMGYMPPIRREVYADAVIAMGFMTRESDALARIARTIIPSLSPYQTAAQFCAAMYRAATVAIADGYTDVIGLSGPEAGRRSDHQRPYNVRECAQVALWIQRALPGYVQGTTQGIRLDGGGPVRRIEYRLPHGHCPMVQGRLNMNRTTKVERKRYSIWTNSYGCWAGLCPQCKEPFSATHHSVSQAGVVFAIKLHEAKAHKEGGTKAVTNGTP